VQATAADCLRETLVRLEEEGFQTVLTTHDEVVVQAAELAAQDTADALGAVMRRGFNWSDGLPLMSEKRFPTAIRKARNGTSYETANGASLSRPHLLSPL
jgi:hypothetical protein